MCRTAALYLVFASLLFACSRPGAGPRGDNAGSGTAAPGDWAVVRLEAEADSLNPATSSVDVASRIESGANNSNLFESLLYTDPKDYSTLQGRLAIAPPEISADHLTYTFTIRDGVKWHDGKPLTPEDVLFSFKAVMDPFVDSAPKRSYLTDLTNVEVLEGRKVRLTVRKPYFMNEIVLGEFIFILPKHIFDPGGTLDGVRFSDIVSPSAKDNPKLREFGEQFNKHPNNRMPVGTGPYKFDHWDTGKEIVLSRNDDYWGTKAYLEKIVYRIITDNTAGLTALKAGEVDFNPRLLPIQYAQQTSGASFDQQFAKAKFTIPVYYFIGWNEDRPFFKDKRVRQAMTMLVDRPQIIQALQFGLAQPAATPFFQGSTELNTDIKALPYDPKRAAELLDEAGWIDKDGDGIREKDGVPFHFEILGSSSSTMTEQVMPILKESLRRVGIDTSERRIEFTVFVNSLRDHRFDAAISGWAGDLVQDPYQIWHSSSSLNRGSNYVSFRNPESDHLLEQARTEFDAEKRREIYKQWQAVIHDQQPYTLLYYPEQPVAYQRRFQNVRFLPVRPGYDLMEWFVPKSSQKYNSEAKVQ